MAHRDVEKTLPEFEHARITTLQLDDIVPRPIGECCVFVEALLRISIEHFEIGEGEIRCGVGTGFVHARRQHAELRTPVAYMILCDDLVPDEAQYSRQRVADHS
jgi:hypothetical protein